MAQDCDEEFKNACSLFETESSPGLLERFFLNHPAYQSLFESLNYQLASEGDMVILGRGAQIVLGKYPGVLKVRVVAPTSVRIKTIAQRRNISTEEAAGIVSRFDRQRRSLIESLFDRDLADWALYDMVINTTNIPIELGADIIMLAVKEVPGPEDPEAQKQMFANLAFAKRVEGAINKKVSSIPPQNLDVQCPEAGKVILSGYVRDRVSRQEAEEVAAAYPGVESVDNQLGTVEITY